MKGSRTWIVLLLTLLFACDDATRDAGGEGNAEQSTSEPIAADQSIDHACAPATLSLSSTFGATTAEAPCCAVRSERGEEQIRCCPAVEDVVHRLCAEGAPTCEGGMYPHCFTLECPPASWPCRNGPGCCNACGPIDPQGCAECDRTDYDEVCDSHGFPHRDICMGTYYSNGQPNRVTIQGDRDRQLDWPSEDEDRDDDSAQGGSDDDDSSGARAPARRDHGRGDGGQ